MKIGFATDTNILAKKNKDGSEVLDVTSIYTQYIEYLKKSNSEHELIYYMPEIVVEELINQKELEFNESYDAFVNKYFNISYGILGEIPKNNIKEKLEQERNEYNNKYKLIKLNYTADLMKEMVDEALTKKAPFDRSLYGGKTDAGFKDALIWKTLVYSTDIDECDEFLFYSADNVFYDNKEKLETEFKEHHPKTNISILHVKTDDSHRQLILNELIEKYELQMTDVVTLYDKNIVKNFFTRITYTPIIRHYYYDYLLKVTILDILFQNFDETDFSIDNVECENNIYNVYCNFRTLKYSTDVDVENKRYIEGCVVLSLKKGDKHYVYHDSVVSHIKVDLGLADTLKGLAGLSSGLGNIGEELSKLTLDNSLYNFSEPVKSALNGALEGISSSPKIKLDDSTLYPNALKGFTEVMEKYNFDVGMSPIISNFDNNALNKFISTGLKVDDKKK